MGCRSPPIRIQVNNRKLFQGFCRGLGIENTEAALRAVDSLDRVGPAGIADLLARTAGATPEQAEARLSLADISAEDASFVDAVRALGVDDPILPGGISIGVSPMLGLLFGASALTVSRSVPTCVLVALPA